MALNTLKDSHCRQARASDKIVKLFDGGGSFPALSQRRIVSVETRIAV